MKTVLYTIGYEGINQKEFFKYLKHNDISVVADVRHLPLSRKKGFSKTSLSEFLSSKDIDYINYRELGADKKLRDKLKEDGNYETFFKAMAKSVLNHKKQLTEINQMLCDGKNVALMCFEKNFKLCHRMVVAKGVKKINDNGLKIKHLTT
ncbi:DUF488 domain-containing protein [Desulfobacterales bacterium HSG16]|nr:DUF488 domain-containing protein [Desulfobacterales bacterium HSG16]